MKQRMSCEYLWKQMHIRQCSVSKDSAKYQLGVGDKFRSTGGVCRVLVTPRYACNAELRTNSANNRMAEFLLIGEHERGLPSNSTIFGCYEGIR